MSFNFDAAIKNAQKDRQNKTTGAIILGQSGAGKSRLCGTFGVKTLYLYGGGEDHGPDSAKEEGGDNIVDLRFDPEYSDDELKKPKEDRKRMTPDEQYDRLVSMLQDVEGVKEQGFKAIVIDGATELEALIRSTEKWKKGCLSTQGKHNGFAEPAMTLQMFRTIIMALKNLQRDLGTQYAVTCILDVKQLEDDGEIVESQPRLTGYSVAEGLIQQFPDVLPIGRVPTEEEPKRRMIQLLAGVTKTSKDQAGRVKKSLNFTPRITGIKDLPNMIPADLAKIAAKKAEVK